MKPLLISTLLGMVIHTALAIAQDRSGGTGTGTGSGAVPSPSRDDGALTRTDRSRTHDTKEPESEPMAPPHKGIADGPAREAPAVEPDRDRAVRVMVLATPVGREAAINTHIIAVGDVRPPTARGAMQNASRLVGFIMRGRCVAVIESPRQRNRGDSTVATVRPNAIPINGIFA